MTTVYEDTESRENVQTLYDLLGFEEMNEDERVSLQTTLSTLVDRHNPLILPDFSDIEEIAEDLTRLAREGEIVPRDVLAFYHRLRISHSNTSRFCGWPDEADTNEPKRPCLSPMRQLGTPVGCIFQCRVYRHHENAC